MKNSSSQVIPNLDFQNRGENKNKRELDITISSPYVHSSFSSTSLSLHKNDLSLSELFAVPEGYGASLIR